MDQLSKFVLL